VEMLPTAMTFYIIVDKQPGSAIAEYTDIWESANQGFLDGVAAAVGDPEDYNAFENRTNNDRFFHKASIEIPLNIQAVWNDDGEQSTHIVKTMKRTFQLGYTSTYASTSRPITNDLLIAWKSIYPPDTGGQYSIRLNTRVNFIDGRTQQTDMMSVL